jgi:hypothetical protein
VVLVGSPLIMNHTTPSPRLPGNLDPYTSPPGVACTSSVWGSQSGLVSKPFSLPKNLSMVATRRKSSPSRAVIPFQLDQHTNAHERGGVRSVTIHGKEVAMNGNHTA